MHSGMVRQEIRGSSASLAIFQNRNACMQSSALHTVEMMCVCVCVSQARCTFIFAQRDRAIASVARRMFGTSLASASDNYS
jgi:hypothetical protein